MMVTKKRFALGLMLLIGLIIFISGAYLTFPWMKGTAGRGDHAVEGGSVLQLSWYLEKGERTEGGFTVSGGKEEVKFYIKNPSGNYVYAPRIVKTQFWNGFTAGQEGIYGFYFENLELSDKGIHGNFRSPYEPSIDKFEVLGLSLMLVGLAILVYSMRQLWFLKKEHSD